MMSFCNLLQNVNHLFSVKWKILSGIISGTFCLNKHGKNKVGMASVFFWLKEGVSLWTLLLCSPGNSI